MNFVDTVNKIKDACISIRSSPKKVRKAYDFCAHKTSGFVHYRILFISVLLQILSPPLTGVELFVYAHPRLGVQLGSVLIREGKVHVSMCTAHGASLYAPLSGCAR